MIARTSAARAAASVILAGALVLGTSGCTFLTTQATLIQYDPSDGVGTRVGDVDVRNAIALLSDDGESVSLLLTLISTSDRTINVTMQYEAGGARESTTKSVNPNSTSSYGNFVGEPQIIIVDPDTEPGALYPVYFQYGDVEGVELLVPVLDGSYEQYADLVPPDGAAE